MVCVCVPSAQHLWPSLYYEMAFLRFDKYSTVFEMEFGVWKTSDKELIFHWEIFNQALNVIAHEKKNKKQKTKRYLFVSDKIVASQQVSYVAKL